MVQKLMKALTTVAVYAAGAAPALAQLGVPGTAAPTVPGGFSSVNNIIGTIFNFVILIAGIAFVVLFLVAGIQYLTAAGNDDQTGKAKKLILDAIVGLVIVLAAWAVGNFILAKLGLNVDTSNGAINSVINGG